MNFIYDKFVKVKEEDFENIDIHQLTWTQRIILSVVFGLFSFLSGFLSFFAVMLLRIRKFSILFTIMNISMFLSIGFLIGFKKNFSFLFKEKRFFSSIGMLFGIVVTLYFGIKKRNFIGCLLGFILEFGCFIFSIFSILPYGEKLLYKLVPVPLQGV